MEAMLLGKTAELITVQEEIDGLNNRAWEIRHVDASQAMTFSKRAYELSEKHNYQQGMAESLRNLGRCNSALGDYTLALDFTFKAVEYFELLNDLHNLAVTLNNLAQIYWELGDYSEALENTLEFLRVARMSGSDSLQADALNNLAMINIQQGQSAKAIQLLEQALPLFRQVANIRGECFALNNLAMMHYLAGRYDTALQYGLESQKIAVQYDQKLLQIKVLDTLGQICGETGQKEQALYFLNKGHELAVENDVKRDEVLANLNIGKILLSMERVQEGIVRIQEALKTAVKLDSKQMLMDCHVALATAYEQINQFETALDHYKKFHQFDKAVFNEEGDQKLKALEVRFETESAQREAEIFRLKNSELKNEIAERKKIEEALRKAKQAAEVANQAKSRFISNVSHELRTPLNGILGYSQILLKDQSLLPKQKRAADIIQHSGEHLLTLINDILDISKIEAQKLELQPSEFDLPQFLQNVVDIFWIRTQEKGIDLAYEPAVQLPQRVVADEKRLRQILINLVGNAIKFTSQGEVKLQISIISQETNQAKLRFSVQDSGVGIAKNDLAKIFEPLVQVGDQKLRVEGTGLGLAISQQLVKAMESQLQVESILGEGSRFWFDVVLPASNVKVSESAMRVIQRQSAQLPQTATNSSVPKEEISFPLPTKNDLEMLFELAMMGDLLNVAQQIRKQIIDKPDLQQFSDKLLGLIENYDEEALISVIQGCLQRKNSDDHTS